MSKYVIKYKPRTKVEVADSNTTNGYFVISDDADVKYGEYKDAIKFNSIADAKWFAEVNLDGNWTVLDTSNLSSKQISDGYHTFQELYQFRFLYNALLFNEWGKGFTDQERIKVSESGFPITNKVKYDVHKSWKHSDGEWCFGEPKKYFIVVAELPTGQISNHYKAEYWDMFDIPEKDLANKFDGHTAEDVMKMMESFLILTNKCLFEKLLRVKVLKEFRKNKIENKTLGDLFQRFNSSPNNSLVYSELTDGEPENTKSNISYEVKILDFSKDTKDDQQSS